MSILNFHYTETKGGLLCSVIVCVCVVWSAIPIRVNLNGLRIYVLFFSLGVLVQVRTLGGKKTENSFSIFKFDFNRFSELEFLTSYSNKFPVNSLQLIIAISISRRSAVCTFVQVQLYRVTVSIYKSYLFLLMYIFRLPSSLIYPGSVFSQVAQEVGFSR